MHDIGTLYKLKPIDSAGVPGETPKRFLGYYYWIYHLKYVPKAWYMSPDSYIKVTVETVVDKLFNINKRLMMRATDPLQIGYCIDLDSYKIPGGESTKQL